MLLKKRLKYGLVLLGILTAVPLYMTFDLFHQQSEPLGDVAGIWRRVPIVPSDISYHVRKRFSISSYFNTVYHGRKRLDAELVDFPSGKLSLPAFKTNTSYQTGPRRKGFPVVPILLWWDSVYDTIDEVKTCGQRMCRISNNRSLKTHPDTKGFIFYGSHFKPYNLPLPRRKDHIWALIHEESPRNAFILSHGNALNIFNFTSTYNRKSDYPITTQWLKCADWIHDTKYVLPLVDKNRLRGAGLAPILYIHSDCGVPSDRDKYVEILQRYIPVDSYGSCQNNRDLPKRLRFRGNMSPLQDKDFYQFVARYKFTLAFENYVCEDYITEKFWRPIRTGSIPIVFGAPTIRDFLPSNKSAIIVDDFEEAEDLAEYIHLLDTNDRLYLEYLDFKSEPVRNGPLLNQLVQRDWEPEYCSKSSMGSRFQSKNSAGSRIQSKNSPMETFRTNAHALPEKTSSKRKYESIFYGFECFLCNAIADMSTDAANQASKMSSMDQYKCPSPRRFDDNGRYSIHDNTWAAEWLYGKYEAMAMENLYNKKKICSKSEFLELVRAEYDLDH